MIVGLF